MENTKRLIDVINYEKWRDDGKYEHMKRDIEKKQKKANAKIKANKHLKESGNTPFGE
jgi:trimethylamine:corrinoid methyltransferase-like protein